MIFDTENDTIWIRQSWLDTAIRCPERGRLAATKPEWDELTSDSAFIGTCAHYGIEQVIRGRDAAHIEEITEAYAHDLLGQLGTIKWTKYTTVDQLARNAVNCAVAWRDGILPRLPWPGRSEVSFAVPLYVRPDGRTVGIKGTIDFLPSSVPELWDWKTAARRYDEAKYHKFAIQPTIYALAAIKGGLATDLRYTLPLTFNYGIMVRGESKSKPQVFSVTRDQGHIDWAMKRIATFVDMGVNALDKGWPTIDEGNYLCSETWCPWFSICRGAHLSTDDDKVTAVPAA